MHQLFLSYNSADRASVISVQKLLQARGITTFLDRDKLVPGLPWPQALEQALRDVDAVAVFIGRQLGGWQKREMWFALDRQVGEEKQGRAFPVIPVLLQEADLNLGFLFTNTWIDLRAGFDGPAEAEALALFERAIKGTDPAAALLVERASICPYRGLQVFREEDAAFFAGRRAFSNQLFEFTRNKELVAIVGPSGSGKSSVVQAGLIPRLRRECPPATTWDTVTFTPGKDPFHQVATALIPFLEPEKDEVERLALARKLGSNLAARETGLEDIIHRVLKKANGTDRMLLVADQFEELFTLTPEPIRRPFVQALLAALGSARFTLLVTLRADFYSQIINLDRDLSDRLPSAQVNIAALTREELLECITAPSKLVGLRFEPGLVDRILGDVGSEPGRLPLVEFALTELWQRRQGSLLTNQAYDDIKGVAGALAGRAEAEFARLSVEEQSAARRLFSRLVRVARPEEAGEDTRQRADLPETDVLARRIANTLANARLLVTSGSAADTLSVEVAHEALLRNWERLRLWLNEDREFLLWRQRLQFQVVEWQEHQLHGDYLLRGTPLSEAERWLIGRARDLTQIEQRLVSDSIALRQAEMAAEEQRRRSEIANAELLREAAEARAEAERKQAAEQKEQARRLRRFSVALATLVLLAMGAAVFAFWQRSQSRARELISASAAVEETDPELAVLIAAHGVVAASQPWNRNLALEAEERLHHAILSSRVTQTLSGHSDSVNAVDWNHDGTKLATASSDQTVKIWDVSTGKELLTLRDPAPQDPAGSTASVAWSPDGQRVATIGADQKIRIWDSLNGKQVQTLSRDHELFAIGVAWSPDGKSVAAAGATRLRVWDVSSGRELLNIRGGPFYGFAWSRDGKRLAGGMYGVKIWDAATGKQLVELPESKQREVTSIAFSQDGKWLATSTSGAEVKFWNAQTGQQVLTLTVPAGTVESMAWSPDGTKLATGSDDNTATIWELPNGRQLQSLNGHENGIRSVAWSPDGKWLATGSADGRAKVWDVSGGEELPALRGHEGYVTGLSWSRDGTRLATSSADHTARVWDVLHRTELFAMKGHSEEVRSVSWSPDGKYLATASNDQTVRLWDAGVGKEIRSFRSSQTGVASSVAWSSDGRMLATVCGGDVQTWDAATGKELAMGTGTNSLMLQTVALSPDGKRFATAGFAPKAEVWDLAGRKKLLELNHKEDVPIPEVTVAWSPDGKRLATASSDHTAKVWDAGTGKELVTLSGHSNGVTSVAWSPDGTRLATGSWDETTRVWRAETGEELFTLVSGHGVVHTLAWSPDGRRLAVGNEDGTVQIYAMELRDLMAVASQRVTAHPSDKRCRKYLHEDRCPSVPKL